MKLLLIAFVLGTAFAAPNTSGIQFRNLYKEPSVGSLKSHHPSGRIINGNDVAQSKEIPYQAFLEFHDSVGGWYCGGSLISHENDPNSPKYGILTAAHCTYNAVNVTVRLGVLNWTSIDDSNQPIIHVTEMNDIISHDNYTFGEIHDDIGLIRLPDSSVSETDDVKPVDLPEDDSNLYIGSTAKFSGWGVTNGTTENTLSDVLKWAESKVIGNEDCEKYFEDVEIQDTHICLSGSSESDEYHSPCDGDTGGPLTITTNDDATHDTTTTQIGITSFTVVFCLEGYPSGFTRTSSYLEWIKENLNPQSSPS